MLRALHHRARAVRHVVAGTVRRVFTASAPVSIVTIHHEGAGTPTNVARGGAMGYTYWIGPAVASRLRSVWVSWATFHFNHRSLDLCISGDRTNLRITDAEISLIRAAYTDAYARGEVVAAPLVRAHRNSPGSSTACPGNATIARWNDIVAACTKPGPAPAPQPKVKPMYSPPLPIVAVLQDTPHEPARAGVGPDGAVYVWDALLGYHGGANGKPYFAGKTAAQLVYPDAKEKAAGKRYVIVSTDGGRYAYPA